MNREELELMRNWFDAVQDLNPAFLKHEDYALAACLYTILGMQVPDWDELYGINESDDVEFDRKIKETDYLWK